MTIDRLRPIDALSGARRTDHMSDLQWDRLLAGELTGNAGDAARAHVARCAACASRLRELTVERDSFQQRPLAIPLLRARQRWLAAFVPVAAAAALLIVLRARPRDDHFSERSKGGAVASSTSKHPMLLLSAGRPGVLAPVATGDMIHPGDSLQASYAAEQAGFGAVLSRDGAGSVTVYVPSGGGAMIPLAAGTERSFPQSTVLDDTRGSERIAIVWCETPHSLEPLLAALREGAAIAAPSDCVVREVTVDKRSSSP